MASTLPPPATTVDLFLKFDNIAGESVDRQHPNQIDLLSYSWGESQPGTGVGGAAGKVSHTDFTVKKRVDKASPTLMLHCANGKHIPNGYMYARKHGTESAVDFLFFKFIDVVITSVQEGGDTTGLHDEVSFAFSSISVEHKGPSGTTSFAWDLKANKIV